jgi:hypothetical protein
VCFHWLKVYLRVKQPWYSITLQSCHQTNQVPAFWITWPVCPSSPNLNYFTNILEMANQTMLCMNCVIIKDLYWSWWWLRTGINLEDSVSRAGTVSAAGDRVKGVSYSALMMEREGYLLPVKWLAKKMIPLKIVHQPVRILNTIKKKILSPT